MPSLTALKVKNAPPGRHGDGGGLYLRVETSGSRKWVFRYQRHGRRHDVGLGSATYVPLAEARSLADQARKMVRDGLDPVLERRRQAPVPTFRAAAEAVHAENVSTWKNSKHGAQWLSTLEAHVFPSLGDRLVSEIDVPEVRDCLAKVWLAIPETARRLRQRIRAVIDWSVSKGHRAHSINMQAVTKGLPRQVETAGHFDAMPFAELPQFFRCICTKESVSTRALAFLILTAA